MFNFGGITHIIDYPSGRFGYVGSVPTSLADVVPATQSDVMGGRARRDDQGKLVSFKFHVHDTAEAAVQEARDKGVNLCDIPTCACRKLF